MRPSCSQKYGAYELAIEQNLPGQGVAGIDHLGQDDASICHRRQHVGQGVEVDGYRALLEDHPWITVLGGCCGTDHRHVAEIAKACC